MDVWDGTSARRTGLSQRAPDRIDWDKMLQQMQLVQNGFNGVDPLTLQSVGAAETVSGMAVTEYGNGGIHKTVFTFTAMELDSVDGTTPATDGAWGSLKLYTFPTGTKLLTAADFYLGLTAVNPVTTGFTATSDFDIGLGSVAVAQASAFSLTGTQNDYAAVTVALAGSTKAAQTNTNVTPASHTATPLLLNVRVVDDADHGTSAGLLQVTGTATVYWSMLR